MTKQVKRIADQVLHAIDVTHDQGLAGQAADVFLTLEHEARLPAVGLYRPEAGRDQAADVQQALDLRQELALGHSLAQQGLQRLGHLVQSIEPSQLVAFGVHDADPLFGRGHRVGAHHHHLFVAHAPGIGPDPAAQWVAFELCAHAFTSSSRPPSTAPSASA